MMEKAKLDTSISELLRNRFTFSMEFFPPRTKERKDSFEKHLAKLEKLNIDFCSITYGAGGTTTELTPEYVVKLSQRFGVPSIAHLTCVEHSLESLEKELDLFDSYGIKNILSLRGDPREPVGGVSQNEIPYALNLLELLRSRGSYCIGVAAHVQGHIDGGIDDFKFQARKIEKADFAITQLFYDEKYYYEFVENLRSQNIKTPIIPGILPLTDLSRVKKIVELSGAIIPSSLIDLLSKYENGSDDQRKMGEAISAELCRKLVLAGAPGLHFYTMNRADSVKAIFERLR